jgi:hypothetical protein
MDNPFEEVKSVADVIGEYVRLRDEKQAYEKKIEEAMFTRFGRRMKEIETLLLNSLNGSGLDSIKSSNGTAFKKTVYSVTVGDQQAFRRHVIGSEAWELVDMRASKTGVLDHIKETKTLVPGVNINPTIIVQVRRPD